jgi:hypothetical protein
MSGAAGNRPLALSHFSLLLSSFPPPHPSHAAQELEIAIHGGPEGGGGAVVGLLAGEGVPRKGEHAAVDRIHDGALGPESMGEARATAWISSPDGSG